MNQQSAGSNPANGGTSLHDLFALTDEQILEIEPELAGAGAAQDVEVGAAAAQGAANATNVDRNAAPAAAVPAAPGTNDPQAAASASNAGTPTAQPGNGPFSAPEDVRALTELYPGGVAQARSAAERARTLDEIDAAYFGAMGNSQQQVSAARAQLAQRMLSEDPAAFREMVFAGLRALEEAAATPQTSSVTGRPDPVGAPQLGTTPETSSVGATLGSHGANGAQASAGGASPAPTGRSADKLAEAQTAAYVAFERAANEELERSVGAAITRTIEQALPSLSRADRGSSTGRPDQVGAPLQARLSAAVREDVEAALKGDRQLSEQIAQILSARRFDNETRAQVVRLIDERARQLVPAAAKLIITDWTQTTLAAHRSKSDRADVASRPHVEPASTRGLPPRQGSASAAASAPQRARTPQSRLEAGATKSDARRVDYRKLSDEQILDL